MLEKELKKINSLRASCRSLMRKEYWLGPAFLAGAGISLSSVGTTPSLQRPWPLPGAQGWGGHHKGFGHIFLCTPLAPESQELWGSVTVTCGVLELLWHAGRHLPWLAESVWGLGWTWAGKLAKL